MQPDYDFNILLWQISSHKNIFLIVIVAMVSRIEHLLNLKLSNNIVRMLSREILTIETCEDYILECCMIVYVSKSLEL